MSASAAPAAAPARVWLARAVRSLLIIVGLLPLIPLLFSGVPGLGAIAAVVDSWFTFQCQREAARSLTAFGVTLPVCARCAGIYFGLGLGAVVAKPELQAWPLRIWVGVAALVMLLDVATEALGMRPASSALRMLTGIALAYPVAVALVLAARAGSRES